MTGICRRGIKKRAATHMNHALCGSLLFFYAADDLCLYAIVFVRNGQFLSAFCTTCSQHSPAVCCGHSFTEAVFVSSLSVRRLKCSFHRLSYFYVIILTNSGCKNRDFFQNKQAITHFLSKVLCFLLICITFAAEFTVSVWRFRSDIPEKAHVRPEKA